MNAALIVLRIIHVLSGIFWVGSMIFVSRFLVPALGDVGPEGGKVMAAVVRRRFMTAVPGAAILTILSGFRLYWHASTRLAGAFMRSGPGIAYSIGALAALIAFFMGMTITRPSMLKSIRLSQSAATAEAAEREKMMAEAQALRTRGVRAGEIITLLLVIAATAMAVGRYV